MKKALLTMTIFALLRGVSMAELVVVPDPRYVDERTRERLEQMNVHDAGRDAAERQRERDRPAATKAPAEQSRKGRYVEAQPPQNNPTADLAATEERYLLSKIAAISARRCGGEKDPAKCESDNAASVATYQKRLQSLRNDPELYLREHPPTINVRVY